MKDYYKAADAHECIWMLSNMHLYPHFNRLAILALPSSYLPELLSASSLL